MKSSFGPKSKTEALIFAEEKIRVNLQISIHQMMKFKGMGIGQLARAIRLKKSILERMLSDDGHISVRDVARIFHSFGYEAIFVFQPLR